VVAREVRFWMKEKVREGVPIARVAREYGVSRQTVYTSYGDVIRYEGVGHGSWFTALSRSRSR
jgi:transposase-like protein